MQQPDPTSKKADYINKQSFGSRFVLTGSDPEKNLDPYPTSCINRIRPLKKRIWIHDILKHWMRPKYPDPKLYQCICFGSRFIYTVSNLQESTKIDRSEKTRIQDTFEMDPKLCMLRTRQVRGPQDPGSTTGTSIRR